MAGKPVPFFLRLVCCSKPQFSSAIPSPVKPTLHLPLSPLLDHSTSSWASLPQLLFPTNPVSFRNFFKMADEVSHVPRLHGRSLGRREAPRTGWREDPAMPIGMAQIAICSRFYWWFPRETHTNTHPPNPTLSGSVPHTNANSMALSTTSSRPRPLAMPVPRPPIPCSALLCGRTGLS